MPFPDRATHPPEAEMTRTLAAAVALAAASIAGTMLAAPAQACISCAYVPETARSAPAAPGEARSYSKSRSFRAAEERRLRHSGNRKAKGEAASRKVETAKTAPTEKPSERAASVGVPAAQNEHSSFAAMSPSPVETAAVPAAAEPGSATEHSTIATAGSRDALRDATTTAAVAAGAATNASAGVEEAKPETPAAAGANVGCKKFFPSVGMTLSVTCE